MNRAICINCSNLHYGGGVQVATSFIHELSNFDLKSFDLEIFCSTEVFSNLNAMNSVALEEFKISVIDVYGLRALRPNFQNKFKKFALIFTIFGPDYLLFVKSLKIVGFAQPWIIYPDNEVYSKMNFIKKNIVKFKFNIQGCFFRRSSVFIVELPSVKNRLISVLGLHANKIFVVPNTVSDVFAKNILPPDSQNYVRGRPFKIGFLGRNYEHKNLCVLPLVKTILKNRYNTDVDFVVTFTADEWNSADHDFKKNIHNIGPLSVVECPFFYKSIDAVIFPSLLECFSATPLEALVSKVPLFASDRKFIRDICGNYCYYFNPLCCDDIAEKIYFYLENKIPRYDLDMAHEYVMNMPNARQRAGDYLGIIDSEFKSKFG